MVRPIGVPACLVPVDPCTIRERVVRWAHVEVARVTPRGRVRINDHLAVPGDIRSNISVAGETAVLPAASNVHKVELAIRATALNYI